MRVAGGRAANQKLMAREMSDTSMSVKIKILAAFPYNFGPRTRMTYCQKAMCGSGLWGVGLGFRVSERTNRKYNMHLGDMKSSAR